MPSREVDDELVRQVVDHLRQHYGLGDEAIRDLGRRLARWSSAERADENRAFAQRFATEHQQTIDRLSKYQPSD